METELVGGSTIFSKPQRSLTLKVCMLNCISFVFAPLFFFGI